MVFFIKRQVRQGGIFKHQAVMFLPLSEQLVTLPVITYYMFKLANPLLEFVICRSF